MKKTINLPQNYLDAMKELLKEDYEDYLASFEEKRLYGLRINTLKISVEDFLKISPFELEPIPWIENGFYFHEEDKPAKHPYYFAGLYYIQEPSAMTPANVLPVEDGDVVFDMCAAPGGKTTQLGARLGGTGLLVANDISAGRAKTLLKNVELAGIRNAIEEQTQRKFEDDYLVAKVEKLESAVRELTEGDDDESAKFSIEELAIILDMDVEEIRDVLRLTGDDK